ncbi:MAG: dethiobiotin synthase [Magnetococcales bacterium]|nr:dethiobiotin synthase [Magnetococcales bacterium]
MIPSPSGCFVTGTDTGVGKSVVAAWLVSRLQADYWKPIQSGLEGESDTGMIQRLTRCQDHRLHPPVFSLTHPLSPHEAARRDGRTIHLDDFSLPRTPCPLVVEGAGGLMVPLNDREFMIDLIVHLGLPVILVTRTTLGTINHTLLSLQALRFKGVPLLGIIANGPENPANLDAIATFGKVAILAHLPPLEPLDATALARIPFRIPFDPGSFSRPHP